MSPILGVQIEIFEALGRACPQFAHFSMLVGAGGEALSKRIGSLSIESFRDEGSSSRRRSTACWPSLGRRIPLLRAMTLDELVAEFDPVAFLARAGSFRYRRAQVPQPPVSCTRPPSRRLRGRLAALGIGGGAAFWETVRDNVELIGDTGLWWTVVNGPIEPVVEDPAFLAQASALLPDGPLTEGSWSAWTVPFRALGVKGKALFMPLRLALTGRPHGPEMKKLLPLIGLERARKRLAGQAA
jgi:glutamyl-tRNA synthetase